MLHVQWRFRHHTVRYVRKPLPSTGQLKKDGGELSVEVKAAVLFLLDFPDTLPMDGFRDILIEMAHNMAAQAELYSSAC